MKSKESGKWLQLQKYLEILNIFSHQVQDGHPGHIQNLFWGGCGYWSRYTNSHFLFLRFSVLVNIKQQLNGSSSKNMSNYHNFFFHVVQGGHPGPIEAFFPLVGYWLRYSPFLCFGEHAKFPIFLLFGLSTLETKIMSNETNFRCLPHPNTAIDLNMKI